MSLAEDLRSLRKAFSPSAKKEDLAKMDRLILQAEHAEYEQWRQGILQQITLDGNTAALNGHNVVLLVNKTEKMGDGLYGFLGSAISAGRSMLLAARDVENFHVRAFLWGQDSTITRLRLDNAYATDMAAKSGKRTAEYFLPAAKEVLLENTPDKVSGTVTHYIVIGDGKISDNPEHAAAILAAAQKFNAHVTFDFIACGKADTSLEKLVAALAPQSRHDNKPGMYAVTAALDAKKVIMQIAKKRISATVPAVTARAAAPKA